MNHSLTLDRAATLNRMTETQYDLIVIGGGVTGAGIALDAATRGIKTALVEKQDFAAGTSSRSTKLIHGGLRYLKQFEVKLVKETGSERAVVHRLAPHLVVAEKMLLPIIKGGSYGKMLSSVGLRVYDILAGVKKEDRRKMLNSTQTHTQEPLLRTEDLLGGGLYAEYRTDDARLTIELIKTAVQYGADCVNYVAASEFIYEPQTGGEQVVAGIRCNEMRTGNTFSLKSKYVVSAAGPWVDELRSKNKSLEGKRLHLTKGVHIVVPKERLPIKQAIYFDIPDGRMMFAIPRGEITYLGTTDTDYKGNKENPRTLKADVDYLLDATNKMFPSANLQFDEVTSSWAGLRPLIHQDGKSASELSRKDEIFVSDTGLISIAGGKLTGYRKMAQRVVDLIAKKMHVSAPCKTHRVTLCGGDFEHAKAVQTFQQELSDKYLPLGISAARIAYLVANYGTQTQYILDLYLSHPEEDAEIRLGLAELMFALEKEMVVSPQDFLIRRTGGLYFDIHRVRNLVEPVLSHMAAHYSWTLEQTETERVLLQQAIYEASHFPEAEVNASVAH